ncbi:hypothetical protein C7974DRAFT_448502 [Boeremia exigua]|uniref:uncharacterized protein n=1 Tax=Boeremia exigua TaxID=749465 RepID=UPI001E8D04FE|nr:uncharacterized protein C7974DRAFT_448502 [Boeremia exigua]KAH6638795.1 hypothetical protein C7974DRAFT_448502 [Boeremia exigua]
MDPLPPNSTFTFLPPLPTPLPALKVLRTSTWTYAGPLLTPSTLPSSLHPWAAATLAPAPALLEALLPLLAFLDAYLRAAGFDHCWLTLRASLPTREWDEPRWHVDEDFFEAGEGGVWDRVRASRGAGASASTSTSETKTKTKTESASKSTSKTTTHPPPRRYPWSPRPPAAPRAWKLTTALHGPSTLFLPPLSQPHALTTLHTLLRHPPPSLPVHPPACPALTCTHCAHTASYVRSALAGAFAHVGAVSARRGGMAVFATGRGGAVHSEPRGGGERVFVGVVPAREEGLEGLLGGFGMVGPRAWVLGGGRLGEGGMGEEGSEGGEKSEGWGEKSEGVEKSRRIEKSE